MASNTLAKSGKEDIDVDALKRENQRLKNTLAAFQKRRYILGASQPSNSPSDMPNDQLPPLPSSPSLQTLKIKYGPFSGLRQLEEKKDIDSTAATVVDVSTHDAKLGDFDDATDNPRKMSDSLTDMKDSLDTTSGSRQFYRQLKEHVESKQFLATLEANRALIVHAKQSALGTDTPPQVDEFGFASDEGQDDVQVGVVDIDDVEWWTLVANPNAENCDDMEHTDEFGLGVDTTKPPPREREVEPTALDGGYVVVYPDDVISGIADFVSLYLQQVPAAQTLSSKELQKMLSGTFAALEEKGQVQKFWDLGMTLYSTYGWTTMTWNLYKDPTMAKYVLKGLWTAARFLLWL